MLNVIGNIIGKSSIADSVAGLVSAYVSRVEADGGVVESEECLLDRITTLKNLGLWDKASAIWMPHGYKEGKLYAVKGGANADLGFTRNGTRTRKGPTYVEEVPYNLLQYSNQFDNGTWSKTNVLITSTTELGPNRSSTASIIDITSTASFIFKTIAVVPNQGYTFSFYVKRGTSTDLRYRVRDFTNSVDILGKTSYWSLTSDEWTRIAVTFTTPETCFSISVYPVNDSNIGTVYLYGVQVNLGDTALDYVYTTNRFNIPALDYTNSTCPALSLEPARTNLAKDSENFASANWVVSGVSVESKVIQGPTGSIVADKIIESTATAHYITQTNFSLVTGTTYAFSVYAKKFSANRHLTIMGFGLGGLNEVAVFNLEAGTVAKPPGRVLFKDAFIEPLLDSSGVPTGWYRCSILFTSNITGNSSGSFGISNNSTDTTSTTYQYAGDGTSGIYICGAQMEVGTYATSYIPTTTGTVTRIADTVTSLVNPDLIGHTQGTLQFEGSCIASSDANQITISDGTLLNRVTITFTTAGTVQCFVRDTTGNTFNISTPYESGTLCKVVVVYSDSRQAMFMNGVKVDEVIGTLRLPIGLTNVNFTGGTAGNYRFYGECRQLLVSKIALTDAEAIALTTP